jgi:hypothetical protein
MKNLTIVLLAVFIMSGLTFGQKYTDPRPYLKVFSSSVSGADEGDTASVLQVYQYEDVEIAVEADDSLKAPIVVLYSGDYQGTFKYATMTVAAGDTVTFTSDAGGYKGYVLRGNGVNRIPGARYIQVGYKTLTGTSADTNGVNVKVWVNRRNGNSVEP